MSYLLKFYYFFKITMFTGTVKFFNETKGFGFIKNEEDGKDVFVHITGLNDGVTIAENDRVQYEVQEGPKGPSAVNVSRI